MKFILFVILLVTGSIISAQDQFIKRLDGTKIPILQIDSTVDRLMKRENIQGLNLAIISNKSNYIKSYGFRNKPKNLLLDTSTIVYGASFSKAVFGYLIMKLVEEKRLAFDTPLYRYLKKPIPEYEYFSDLKGDDRWKSITARMCLSHTTGLPNVRWFHPETSAMDSLGVIRIYFTPGSKYAYSGEGFKLCNWSSKKLRDRAQTSWQVKEYLFHWVCNGRALSGMNPLGMIMSLSVISIMGLLTRKESARRL
jgi:CubicO group peptidase (beta-lactamase class C family)